MPTELAPTPSHNERREAASQFLDQFEQLHSAPPIIQELLRLTSESNFEVGKVSQCLSQDPAFSAKILRLVNSSSYGLRNRITSTRHAVAFLGRRSIRLLCLSFGLVDALTGGEGAQCYVNYWRRSLTMAAAASRLAEETDGVAADTAYTAGMLADVGMLVFMQADAAVYTELCESTPHGPELVATERAVFGVSHCDVGARLQELWRLPDELQHAAGGHHESGAADDPLVRLIQLASLVADVLWTPETDSFAPLKVLATSWLGISADPLVDLLIDLRNQHAEMANLFGVCLGEAVDCETLRKTASAQFAKLSLEVAAEFDSLAAALGDDDPA